MDEINAERAFINLQNELAENAGRFFFSRCAGFVCRAAKQREHADGLENDKNGRIAVEHACGLYGAVSFQHGEQDNRCCADKEKQQAKPAIHAPHALPQCVAAEEVERVNSGNADIKPNGDAERF